MVVGSLDGCIVRCRNKTWIIASHEHEDYRLIQEVELLRFPELSSTMNERFSKGYDLQDTTYLPSLGKWLLMFSKDLRLQQKVALESSWTKAQRFVRKMWDEGYTLTSLAYGERVFLLVMSRGGVLEVESRARLMRYESFDQLKAALRAAWSQEDMMLGDLCYSDEYGWCASLTARKPNIVDYSVFEFDDKLEDSAPLVEALQTLPQVVRAIVYGPSVAPSVPRATIRDHRDHGEGWKVITLRYDPNAQQKEPHGLSEVEGTRSALHFGNSWKAAKNILGKLAESQIRKPSVGLCLTVLDRVAESSAAGRDQANSLLHDKIMLEAVLREAEESQAKATAIAGEDKRTTKCCVLI